MANKLLNPVGALSDFLKRNKIKGEILNLMRKRHPGIDRGLQFEGVTLSDPSPEHATLLLVLQDILTNHPEFDLVQWPGGVALVRKAQTESLDKSIREVNEKTNFIISGGSDKAANLADNVAAPTGTVKEEK